MRFYACILTKYPFISQVNQILPQRSIEVTGGQNFIFHWHQNSHFRNIFMFVDMNPLDPYEAFNETLTVVKDNFRAIF